MNKALRKPYGLSDNRASYIKKLVEIASKADADNKVFGASSHKYRLNPIVSIETVRQFEKKYHITLPEEYIFFLTRVGNGGAGPYYGLYPLEKLELYNEYLQALSHHPEADYPILIDRNMTAASWNARIGMLKNDAYSDEAYDTVMKQISSGTLIIGTQGCTYDNLLMCRGSETGKMVYIDWNLETDYPPFLTGMTFLDWYENFFEEIIAGNNTASYGYKMLGTEEELSEAYEAAADLEEKSRILSSFYRFQQLADKTIALFVRREEKSLDAAKAELLFRNDLEKGLKVFERLLEGENPEAAVSCARRMPEQYKNNYYKGMLSLLYGENNTNKKRLLFFLHDCSCRKAADIVAFATDGRMPEEIRKTAVYVTGDCDDTLDYMEQFIAWMKGDSYWIAHTALQAMIRTKSEDAKLRRTYEWMWEKYKDDKVMRSNLEHIPKSSS